MHKCLIHICLYVWCLICYPNFTKHHQRCMSFLQTWIATKSRPRLTPKSRLAIDGMTGLPRASFALTGFDDQVWAWLLSDWLRRPGPCSLWLLRCGAAATCNLLWTRLTDQLWGTHCICLFLRLVRFMNNTWDPCFCCFTIFWKYMELVKPERPYWKERFWGDRFRFWVFCN